MPRSIHRVGVIVKSVMIDGDVKLFELGDEDNWELPHFTSGAHVDIHLPSGKVRQYSLWNDPKDRTRYCIAVRRVNDGRGGSAEMHDAINEGQRLLISLPRNHFPLAGRARRHIMIAGGIGITPFLSMLPVLARENAEFVLYYVTPGPDRMPFKNYLKRFEDHVVVHHSQKSGRMDIQALIDGLGNEDQLYCCGPSSMIEICRNHELALGERLHVEHFGIETIEANSAYEIEIASSGRIIPVSTKQTMLEALRIAEVEIPASCEGGVCLDCKTRYLSGTPIHRDTAMPKSEREQYLTPCVSGCAGGRIKLDL